MTMLRNFSIFYGKRRERLKSVRNLESKNILKFEISMNFLRFRKGNCRIFQKMIFQKLEKQKKLEQNQNQNKIRSNSELEKTQDHSKAPNRGPVPDTRVARSNDLHQQLHKQPCFRQGLMGCLQRREYLSQIYRRNRPRRVAGVR